MNKEKFIKELRKKGYAHARFIPSDNPPKKRYEDKTLLIVK